MAFCPVGSDGSRAPVLSVAPQLLLETTAALLLVMASAAFPVVKPSSRFMPKIFDRIIIETEFALNTAI